MDNKPLDRPEHFYLFNLHEEKSLLVGYTLPKSKADMWALSVCQVDGGAGQRRGRLPQSPQFRLPLPPASLSSLPARCRQEGHVCPC